MVWWWRRIGNNNGVYSNSGEGGSWNGSSHGPYAGGGRTNTGSSIPASSGVDGTGGGGGGATHDGA